MFILETSFDQITDPRRHLSITRFECERTTIRVTVSQFSIFSSAIFALVLQRLDKSRKISDRSLGKRGGTTRMRGNSSSANHWLIERTIIAHSAFTAILAGLTLWSTVCFAEGKIGNAITIKNQVEGVTAAGTQPIATGGEVFSNELVRTGGESKAQLLFVDNTNLSVGPLSTIRLDTFVYDPNAPKGNVVLRAGVGAFRFITGLQDPKSYTIKTEFATIGVRGTEFYLLNTQSEVRLQLIHGQVFGTTISGQHFVLDQVNEVLSIDSNGQVHRLGTVNKPLVDFADLGPPITHYAGLFPSETNIAGGIAVIGGIVGAAVLIGTQHSGPASP